MFVFSDGDATNFPPVCCAHSPFGGNFRPKGSQHNSLVYFIYSYILICLFYSGYQICLFLLWFASILSVTMFGKVNDPKNDQGDSFVRCRWKETCPPPNREPNRTELFSNSFLANTLTVNLFCACLPRFPSSMELWPKGPNLHTRHIAMLPTSIHMSDFWSWRPDPRESWLAYMSEVAVQTSYTTSSRFCSPHVCWNWREIRFSLSGKTWCSEQLM